jgi:hypothetical protein
VVASLVQVLQTRSVEWTFVRVCWSDRENSSAAIPSREQVPVLSLLVSQVSAAHA